MAAQSGDTRALERLKELGATKYTQTYGGILNQDTGELIGADTSRAAIAKQAEEGKNARSISANQIKLDVAAAKAAGTFRDPATITQSEKDNALVPYIASGGTIGRNMPAWVKNNIITWAAEKGITAEDLKSGKAQDKFDQSSANASGRRAGSMANVEAVIPALAENALNLADKLGNAKFVPLNELVQYGESKISDPDLSAFKVAHQSLVSEFNQMISRGGTGSVESMREAGKLLNGASDYASYKSAVDQVIKEVEINKKGLANVRSNLGKNENSPAVPQRTTTASSSPTVGAQPMDLGGGWTVRVK